MFILAAVIVGARRATVHNVVPAAQNAEAVEGSRSSVFAYSH